MNEKYLQMLASFLPSEGFSGWGPPMPYCPEAQMQYRLVKHCYTVSNIPD